MELEGLNVGGICGRSGNLKSNEYSVYSSDLVASGIGIQSSGTDSSIGIKTEEFTDASNFRGWDTSIWDFSKQLPSLKNMSKVTDTVNNIRFQIGADSDEATNAIYIDTALNLDIHEFNFASVENCNAVIEKIDLMLTEINKKTSLIGATYSRLESVMDLQNTQLENYTSALSTIMDADIAEESANYVKAQILQQTTSSLLSQAQSIQASVILNMINSLK